MSSSLNDQVDEYSSSYSSSLEDMSNSSNSSSTHSSHSKSASAESTYTTDDTEERNKIKEEEGKLKEISFFQHTLNLLNCMMGAGILSISSTFKDSGIIVSFIIMIAVAVITHFATVIVLTLQRETKAPGYDEMAKMILGKFGSYSLSAMILILNTAGTLAYLVLCVDFITSWFGFAKVDVSSSLYRAIITFVYGLLIPIALSIPRSLHFLSYLSSVSIFCIVFYMLMTFVKFGMAFHETKQISNSIELAKIDLSIFSSISIYASAFSLPVAILPLMYQFTDNLKTRNRATGTSLLITFLLSGVPALFGYLIFGSDTEGNVLNNYPDDDVIITIVRVGFFLIVTMSYPLIQRPISCSWSAIIFKQNNANELTGWRRALVLCVSNGIPLIIAMFLPEMKPALEVGGALGACLGNFTIPGAMLLKHGAGTTFKKVMAGLLAAFGVIVAVIATYTAVISAIEVFKNVSL
ncbi:Transmembrane amino acid transporter protein [Tritrichomonas foetus]|uniref:Transmembrane amino acid transporter protein n=1 Tax=Tritrichomonas foetus TaxID=1144522 RepID=A0A1J4K9Y5_9EUKA|nr:Transmembrane amino acid transporter protein [Tritrichomonas foetus]|eukprot:OHT07770.1 Transmembrane amino acid transporter protein [Tritrichomonas foetus]